MSDLPPPGTFRRGFEPPPPPRPDVPLPPLPSERRTLELDLMRRQPQPTFECAPLFAQRNITVLVFTSFVPSHPDPWVLDWTIHSIRQHLPESRVIVFADGMAGPESSAYTEFKKAARSKYEVVDFDGPHHLSLMFRHALARVHTRLILTQEHDWALQRRYVDWRNIVNELRDSTSPFQAIQLMQGIMGPSQWCRLDGPLVERRGLTLAPTRAFLISGCVARVDWCFRLTEHLTIPEHVETPRFTERVCDGRDRIAWYIPKGPVERGHHLDGQHARQPPKGAPFGEF